MALGTMRAGSAIEADQLPSTACIASDKPFASVPLCERAPGVVACPVSREPCLVLPSTDQVDLFSGLVDAVYQGCAKRSLLPAAVRPEVRYCVVRASTPISDSHRTVHPRPRGAVSSIGHRVARAVRYRHAASLSAALMEADD